MTCTRCAKRLTRKTARIIDGKPLCSACLFPKLKGGGKLPTPKDFDRKLWLDPFTFEGLIGAAIADGLYSELFRPDGFAKPITELAKDKRIAKLIARL